MSDPIPPPSRCAQWERSPYYGRPAGRSNAVDDRAIAGERVQGVEVGIGGGVGDGEAGVEGAVETLQRSGSKARLAGGLDEQGQAQAAL